MKHSDTWAYGGIHTQITTISIINRTGNHTREAHRGPPWCNRTLVKVLGFQWKIGPALAEGRPRDMKDQQKSSHEDKIPRYFKAKYAGWFLESRKRWFETGRRSASEGMVRWNNEEKGTEHWKEAMISQKTVWEHRYIIWWHHLRPCQLMFVGPDRENQQENVTALEEEAGQVGSVRNQRGAGISCTCLGPRGQLRDARDQNRFAETGKPKTND